MNKIYLVFHSDGSYSDFYTQNLKAFIDENNAKKYIESLKKLKEEYIKINKFILNESKEFRKNNKNLDLVTLYRSFVDWMQPILKQKFPILDNIKYAINYTGILSDEICTGDFGIEEIEII